MQILHSQTTLGRPPRLLRLKMQILPQKPKILGSENVNFALKNCNFALNRSPRILRSENGNSGLEKWKFRSQKWKFCNLKMENSPQCHRKQPFSAIFRAKWGISALFRAFCAQVEFHTKFRDRRIVESGVWVI